MDTENAQDTTEPSLASAGSVGSETAIDSRTLAVKLHAVAAAACYGDQAIRDWLHIAANHIAIHNMGITGYGRWIPVTQRLPPHDETVLYTCDLGPNEGFTDIESGRWDGERNDMGQPAMRPVWGDKDDWGPCSHWMPLPAPPKTSK